jgi:molybdenum cofactor sulfurtransferase
MQPPIKDSRADDLFSRLRKSQYSRLDMNEHVYLDYTGGNLHPDYLVKQHYRFLQNAVYGNPHSVNPASRLADHYIELSRTAILDFFNAHDYYCIFTSNATMALQIVGECYQFSQQSHFLLTADNHNSVNGIREYCKTSGCHFTYTPMNFRDLTINETELNKNLDLFPGSINKLFAYPAQSNASGVRHSLNWIRKAQDRGWNVLLDAAAFVPTSALDLSKHQPDFVCMSFYKMFGYPTGIGCLLVKKTKFNLLRKPWYAGGTITLSANAYSAHFLRNGHARFENGTLNYLEIPAIKTGLDFLTGIGMENICTQIKLLSDKFLKSVLPITHDNGQPLIKLYGPQNSENRGANFLINFFDDAGIQYPCTFIEQLAGENNLSIRTGCFCNPGIDELNNGISESQLRKYFTSRSDGDYDDMISVLGKTRGAIRISLGLPANESDIQRFVAFCEGFIGKKAASSPGFASVNGNTNYFD